MVTGKIAAVDDDVCQSCSQCWDDECRAFLMPHSEGEYNYRTGNGTHGGRMACSRRNRHAAPFPEVVQAQFIPMDAAPHEYLEYRPLEEVVDANG